MALVEYLVILSLFFVLVSIAITTYTHQKHKTGIPTNWPVLGTLPGLLANAHQLHDYTTKVLIMQSRGSAIFKGPWLANMDMVFTANPLDVNHILSKHFSNYPKGDKFYQIFDILGNGILNSDGKIWEISHSVIFSIFKHPGFQRMMETNIWDKLENGLLPILESVCEDNTEIDMQDMFQRFSFDNLCKLLFDKDPESLSLGFPYNPYLKAFSDAEEAILLRHVTPRWLWKLQQVLKVGKEKKLSDAWKLLDQFIYKCLAEKQEYNDMSHDDPEKFIFIKAIMGELKDHIGNFEDPTKFLRDTIINLMAAGKDSIGGALSWFFYLLAGNPTVEAKILEEIRTHLEVNAHKRWSTKDLEKMVYLHGALCESLRLYPPVPFNNKSPIKPETLPSGTQVYQDTNIILCFYAMGRMKSIWGEDCMEFKPERWISSSGGIKHEPSYKFPIFNAGPRACLGKNMAFSQLKIVTATIIYRYHTRVMEGHDALPADSILLMKHGMKVRLIKRSEVN